MLNPTAFTAVLLSIIASASIAFAHDDHGKDKLAAGGDKEVTGEVVDLMCYIDHNATGDKHAKCAATCIKNGGPVGLATDSKVYLVVGEHKTINDQLVEHAGKTITMKGKVAERNGMTMLENAEIVKK